MISSAPSCLKSGLMLAHTRGCGTQLEPVVFSNAGSHRRDDDLAPFQAERDFAAGSHAGGLANVLRDGDLALLGDVHGW